MHVSQGPIDSLLLSEKSVCFCSRRAWLDTSPTTQCLQTSRGRKKAAHKCEHNRCGMQRPLKRFDTKVERRGLCLVESAIRSRCQITGMLASSCAAGPSGRSLGGRMTNQTFKRNRGACCGGRGLEPPLTVQERNSGASQETKKKNKRLERRQLGALHVESVGVDVPGADAIQIVLAPWAERRRRGARSGVAHDRMSAAQGAVVNEILANLHLVKHLNLSVSRPHRLPQFLLTMALATKPRCGRVQTPRLHLCGRRTLQACASCGASHAARVAAGA